MTGEDDASTEIFEEWGFDILSALDDPGEFNAEIARLPPAIADIVCVMLLDGEVQNGGFFQYFFNASGVSLERAIQGFDSMGLLAFAEIARDARAQFGSYFPADQTSRIERIGNYDNKLMRFDKHDEAYSRLDTQQLADILNAHAIAAMNRYRQ